MSNSLILLRTSAGSGRFWIASSFSERLSAGLPQDQAGWPKGQKAVSREDRRGVLFLL